MKTNFIILLIFFLIGPSATFAYVSDVQSEKEIVLLELQLQSRINQAIRLIFDDLNFHTSVSVKLNDQKSNIEKNMENNELDYLPLIIKDQANAERNILRIDSYDIRVVSQENFSSETKAQIKELITGELKGKKFNINFVQVGNFGLWFKTRNVIKTVFVDGIWIILGILGIGAVVFLGYQWFGRKKLLTKMLLNTVSYSNVDELVKFIRNEVSKDKNILKNLVKEDQREILGLKSLIPYLKIQFSADEIFAKSTLLRVEQEQGCFSEGEFSSWLKDFSERLSSRLIKDGNGPMMKKPSEEIIAQFKNIHIDITEKVLKEIDDVSTYAVAFQYLSEDQGRTLSARFKRPVWSDLSSKDLYGLNHEHILKNIITKSQKISGADAVNVSETKTKNTEDMIAQVFASHGKSVKFESAKPDALDESLNMFAEKLETKKGPTPMAAEESPSNKVNDDMINQLLKQHGKIKDTLTVVASPKTVWTKESLSKLPASYLTRKLESRSAEEIATLLHGLPKSTRYFIISHIAQEKVNSIMMILESLTDDDVSKKAVECFVSEVSSDFVEGLFQVDEKKAA